VTPITWEGTAHCPSSLLMVRLKVPGSNRGSGSVVTGGGGCSSYVASQDLLIGIVLIPTPLLARGGGGGAGVRCFCKCHGRRGTQWD